MDMRIKSLTLVFLMITMSLANSSIFNVQKSLLEDENPRHVDLEIQEVPWEFRQLPNVTTIHDHGGTEPWSQARVQVLQSLVKEGDGIYFALWVYATETERYYGDLGLQLGDHYIDGRPAPLTSGNSVDFVALGKLGMNGQWEWGRYLGTQPSVVYQMIEWSDLEIAVIGDESQDHEHKILIINTQNQITYQSESVEQGIRYITSNNYDHYFSKNINQYAQKGPFGLDNCSNRV